MLVPAAKAVTPIHIRMIVNIFSEILVALISPYPTVEKVVRMK